MAKATVNQRALRYAAAHADPEFPLLTVRLAYLAGWHARGRAERITKAERAVVEAAVKLMKRSVPGNVIRLRDAVKNLERARRKA